jgi:hypothetical protein
MFHSTSPCSQKAVAIAFSIKNSDGIENSVQVSHVSRNQIKKAPKKGTLIDATKAFGESRRAFVGNT